MIWTVAHVMNHHKTQDYMITTMQERIHLIIAKKYPTIESILMCLMHMQGTKRAYMSL